jgi:hypothetical protein
MRSMPLVCERARLAPIPLLEVAAADPGKRDEIDDLVLIERIDCGG